MNESFKLFLMKRWTVLDDRIVVGKEEILFKDITNIENELPTGGAGDGIVNLYAFGQKRFLYYPGKDVQRANKTVDYVIDCIQPDGKKEPYEYRKKCDVCGFVFCYTRDDVRNNKKYLQQAEFAENSALTHSLFVGQGTAIQKKMEAEQARSKYRDFNRCPQCNSTDLVDISDI